MCCVQINHAQVTIHYAELFEKLWAVRIKFPKHTFAGRKGQRKGVELYGLEMGILLVLYVINDAQGSCTNC